MDEEGAENLLIMTQFMKLLQRYIFIYLASILMLLLFCTYKITYTCSVLSDEHTCVRLVLKRVQLSHSMISVIPLQERITKLYRREELSCRRFIIYGPEERRERARPINSFFAVLSWEAVSFSYILL